MGNINLINGEALEELRKIPDRSVSLIIVDPPYNIGKDYWDKVEGYTDWCVEWLNECSRVLKVNGVLYLWHNQFETMAELAGRIKNETPLKLVSFCVWDKGKSYNSRYWVCRRPECKTALRSWFNICEYCLHFFNTDKGLTFTNYTGLERIRSDPDSFKELKQWYRSEQERLGLDDKAVAAFYEKQTGKHPHMVRHYFADSQFTIPTKPIWEAVFEPLGFNKKHEEIKAEYDAKMQEYEGKREGYESKRNTHNPDELHGNLWHVNTCRAVSLHPCQKPLEIFRRLVRVSSNEGDTVLDCFMGSGTTGVACVLEGRNFIGIERDEEIFQTAQKRIRDAGEEGET